MFGKQKKQVDIEAFAMYDSKVLAYSDPMFAINQHDMTRQILNTFKDPSQSQNKYLVNAEDYSLFKVGEYDRKQGIFTGCNPEHVANIHDIRAAAQQGGIERT
jgi:hypothetical protein